MVADIRENYNKETQRMKQFTDKEISDLKQLENSEKARIRDDYQERLQEKFEEIRQLRQEKDSLLMKYEKLMQELEFTKMDSKEKTFQLETKQSSLESRESDINNLKETIYELNQKIVELQESLKKENYEKLNLISVRDTLTHEMNVLKKEYKSLELEMTTLKLENNKLLYETTDLHSKKETVEVVSRENEKYRVHKETLLAKVQELEYKLLNLNKELEFASQENHRIMSEKQSLSHELNKLQENFVQSQSLLTEMKECFIKEKEKNTFLESKNFELKSSCTHITTQHDNVKKTTEEKEREMSSIHEEWERKWSSMISIYILMDSALLEWDDSLASLVDGHQNRQQRQVPTKGFTTTAHNRSFRQSPSGNKGTSFSPTSRKQHQNHKSHGLLAFDQDYYSNLLSSSYLESQAKQDIAILIERISLKFDRIVHIRSSYTQEASQVVQTFTQFQDQVASRLTASNQQIVLLQSELSHLQKTLQHTREVSYKEKQELSSSKERLVHEHQKNYKELDMKHQEILIKYETMKLQDEYHQQQIQNLNKEKQELQKQVRHLSKEKEVIPVLEMKNNELQERILELSSQNIVLEQDKKHFENLNEQNMAERNLFQQEKQNFLLEQEKLLLSINLLKENEKNFEKANETLTKEKDKAVNAGSLSFHSWIGFERKLVSLFKRTEELMEKQEDLVTAVNNPSTRFSLASVQQMVIELQAQVHRLLHDNQYLLGKLLPFISQVVRTSSANSLSFSLPPSTSQTPVNSSIVANKQLIERLSPGKSPSGASRASTDYFFPSRRGLMTPAGSKGGGGGGGRYFFNEDIVGSPDVQQYSSPRGNIVSSNLSTFSQQQSEQTPRLQNMK
jgi:hypothetical protein